MLAFNFLYIPKRNKLFSEFKIKFGFFEYLVIFFGLYNRTALFQHFMNSGFKEYLDNLCITYLDEIWIYNDNKLENEINVRNVPPI